MSLESKTSDEELQGNTGEEQNSGEEPQGNSAEEPQQSSAEEPQENTAEEAENTADNSAEATSKDNADTNSGDSSQTKQKKQKKRGVVYISRLPPGMKPQVLRQILSQFAEVHRIWCTNVDKESKRKYRKTGAAAPEAWVEFSSRKTAKRIAEMLNCQPIGVGRFKEDLWTMKYLRGFQWQDLMNQLLYEKKVKMKRLEQRVSMAKREVNIFLENREKDLKAERRAKKRKIDSSEQSDTDGAPSSKKVKVSE